MVKNGGYSILLVEEDDKIALSVKLQLELGGFEVDMNTDPAVARAKYCKNPAMYRLVIMDMKMAGMSAFEFIRAVKTADANSKILLITPFEIRTHEFSQVIPSGKVNGFVERPHLSTRLVTSVKEALGNPLGENL